MPEAFHGLQLPLSFPVLSKVGAAGGWLPCAHADVLAFGHGTHTLRQVPIEGIAVAWQTHGQDQVQDNCYTYSKISKPNWPRANQGITDDFLKWKSRYGHKKTMAIVNHGGHGVTRLGRLKSMHLVSPAGDSWQKKDAEVPMNKTSTAPDSPFFSPAADAISNTEATYARLMGEWYPAGRREQAKVIRRTWGCSGRSKDGPIFVNLSRTAPLTPLRWEHNPQVNKVSRWVSNTNGD